MERAGTVGGVGGLEGIVAGQRSLAPLKNGVRVDAVSTSQAVEPVLVVDAAVTAPVPAPHHLQTRHISTSMTTSIATECNAVWRTLNGHKQAVLSWSGAGFEERLSHRTDL